MALLGFEIPSTRLDGGRGGGGTARDARVGGASGGAVREGWHAERQEEAQERWRATISCARDPDAEGAPTRVLAATCLALPRVVGRTAEPTHT
jgi:hypothetical protein